MSDTFHDRYADPLNIVFLERARQQLAQGEDGLASANAYADQGKPDFALAYLLLVDQPEEVKRDILARAYERRAIISDEKAMEFDRLYHRPFPLIKLEAQKDRMSAQQVRQGKKVRRSGKSLNMS
jgi:hypothetical protein